MRLVDQYRHVRHQTNVVCQPLQIEDYMAHSAPWASPAKWHLGHTTWFFETFILIPFVQEYHAFDSRFNFLFNSYYNAVGDRLARAHRGSWSRPGVSDIYRYRQVVDEAIIGCLSVSEEQIPQEIRSRVVLGLHHEQQHQELILTDLLHHFSVNPFCPAYTQRRPRPSTPVEALHFEVFQGRIAEIGHVGDDFAFDNELPRHRVLLHPFALANRLTTCGEYLAFIEAGGYHDPKWWLSDGWDVCRANNWEAPLYWRREQGKWHRFGLHGLVEIEPEQAVAHVSYYEADAFARWSGARLATEFEWESVFASATPEGSFVDSQTYEPTTLRAIGEVWQWTASAYLGYPGYRPFEGALGEYNGKFMCNQFVLRGGSCLTPSSHFRTSYRNFFSPETRWQMTGILLAKDVLR
jgi:ergothioneine biosynthesis protein EgtB